jgi:predicted outer membrane repeat protein
VRRVLVTLALVTGSLTLSAPAAWAATTIAVHDEAEWRAALATLTADTSPGPHTIEIATDFALSSGPTPVYDGVRRLIVDGGGHTVSADGSGFGFLDNQIETQWATRLTIRDLTVTGFESPGPGGAVSSLSPMEIDDSVFTDNVATDGVGGAVYDLWSVTATDSTFDGNSAPAGGAIAGRGANLQHSLLTNNEATSGNGGAVLTRVLHNGTFTRLSSFVHNTAAGDGGAISGEIMDIGRARFEGNLAGDEGGAVRATGLVQILGSSFVDNHAAVGGALTGRRLRVQISTFVGNSASVRGGAYASPGHFANLRPPWCGPTHHPPAAGTPVRPRCRRASRLTATVLDGAPDRSPRRHHPS